MLERLESAATRELALDIGTGDGAFVLRSARAEPGRFHIGIDSNADNLAEASRRAARKPARGGVANALFVRAAVEQLPPELNGLATVLTVLLPWGSLLRAMAGPDAAVLAGLRALCVAGTRLDVVMGYDERSDPETARVLAPLTPARLDAEVLPRYRDAGFAATAAPLDVGAVKHLGTTWAGRLAFGRERPFWRLTAIAV